jgi:hypothetical protein
MEAVENRVIELTEAICNLYLYDHIDSSHAIKKLTEQGYENVSVKFVWEIYERLIKETDDSKTVS